MTTITGNPRTPPDSSASPCLHKSHLTEYVGNTFIPDFRMTIHDFFIQKAEHMLRNTTKSVAAIRSAMKIRRPLSVPSKKNYTPLRRNISVSTVTHYLKPETIPDKFTDRYLQTDLPESALKNNTPDKFRIPSG